jgi:ribosomal protein L9
MGKLADTLRNVTLTPEKKQQVAALDHEFEDLKAQERELEAANLKLNADAGRAHGEDSIAEITCTILSIIAGAGTEIDKDSVIAGMGLVSEVGDRHIDVLLGKKFIVQSQATNDGIFYRATAEGRAYLARHGKPGP